MFPRRSKDQKSTPVNVSTHITQRRDYAESGQTLQGLFSAASKPNFASKYSFESSRRDLHNALLCTVLDRSLISTLLLNVAEVFAEILRLKNGAKECIA